MQRFLTLLVILMTSSSIATAAPERRVPAEWESQEAIWLQWPGPYEKAHESAFAKMADIIVRYERLHILVSDARIERQARAALESIGSDPAHHNLVWHRIGNDNAWMRDNGPVYVVEDGVMRIQNWEFNAWGGAFGSDVPFRQDDTVPDAVGQYLNMPVDRVDIVHERGNLEFNGIDTVILNWSTLGDRARNANYDRAQAKLDLKHHFGVSKVVFIDGVPDGDRTKGHVDGLARFINPTTVVVPQCTPAANCSANDSGVYESVAQTVFAAGFEVIRDPVEGVASYDGYSFSTNYMNWLVGNGFVLVVGFGNEDTDEAARQRISAYFPERDVHVIEMLSSWASGGGVHCHTNDQPALY